MSIGWLLYVLLTGTLLALAASAASAALARNGRPLRWTWCAAILGTIALAAIAPRKPFAEAPLVESVTEPANAPVSRTRPEAAKVDRMRDMRSTLDAVALLAVANLERRVPAAAMSYALLAWVIVSTAMLAVFGFVSRRLAVARQRWPLQLLHGTPVRLAPALGPAVIGTLRPEIIVPPSLLQRPDEEQRLILAHEREHVRARDHLLLGGAWLTAILLPWHPAVWFMVNRLRLAIELDCDARVLRGGASPARYGRLLIDMAAWRGASRFGALALTDGISHLERRILAMRASRSRHAAARGVALAAFGGLLVLVACEARIPTSAEIAQMDVAKAQQSVGEVGLLRTPSSDRTDFFINGVPASAEAARALEARQVGSITLVRSELPSGRDTMFVVTADRLSDEEKRARSAKQPDPLEAVAPSLVRKLAPDTERIVAHVEQERERMRGEPNLLEKSASQPRRVSGRFGPDEKPIITIDGKLASETQLAALQERDIASIAIYKGKEALLNLISDGKEHLEVTSDPAARTRVMESNALVAVTTKMARAATTKRP